MARIFYTIIWYLLSPVALFYLFLRGTKEPAYRDRLPERFGLIPEVSDGFDLWIHAASVGEVQALSPLLKKILLMKSDVSVVVTTLTPTGAQRVWAEFPDQVKCYYLPFDLPGSTRRFLDRVQPRCGLIMETELWPNLYHYCQQRRIPLTLVNARLSKKSFTRYQSFRGLIANCLASVNQVLAQSELDARRFRLLGARHEAIQIMGNIKFDVALSDELITQAKTERAEWGQRPVWIAASTHEGEEVAALHAHRQVLNRFANALLILVPRHPRRFHIVGGMIQSSGMTYAIRSSAETVRPTTQVYLADTLGELRMLYGCADVAFVGGTLVNIGGHNLLEPAAMKVPVLFGPHVENCLPAMEALIAGGGGQQVSNESGLATTVIQLLADKTLRQKMGQEANLVVTQNMGALDRAMDALFPDG